MAGVVRLPTVDGELNRRQNLRFLIPYHSPYILYRISAQTALALGQVQGSITGGEITERGTRGEKHD